jgi:hypothetical protein
MEASGTPPVGAGQTAQPGGPPPSSVADTVAAVQQGGQDTNALLHQLIEDQKAQRAEIAQLRADVTAGNAAAIPAASVTIPSDDDKRAARLAEVAQYSYYCPGCGRLYNYPAECTGSPEAPHPPIQTVSTEELQGDPAGHTPAPASG